MENNFILPSEVSYFVQSIRPFPIDAITTIKWVDMHEMIVKLSQQAILEAAEYREELVKELLVSCDKIKLLVREVISVSLWKTRVLPNILNIDPNPDATFFIYSVLYHEGAAISLLDTALFHEGACQVLGDAAIDLIDYCAQGVAQVIGLCSMRDHENETKIDVDESVLSEMERQKRDLIFKIGLRCISILCYLSDKHASLPMNVIRRMVVTHDVPWLMADLLHFRPWERIKDNKVQRFLGDKWLLLPPDELTKAHKLEVQSWFCMRQILLSPRINEYYQFTEARRGHFSKCLGLLHELLLDQLPPLIDLKQLLQRMELMGCSANATKNLILEEVPEIRNKLMAEIEQVGGFIAVANRQSQIFASKNKKLLLTLAQRLNEAYNTDMIAKLEQKINEQEQPNADEHEDETSEPPARACNNCKSSAQKKCGNCKAVYYCSRECQHVDWAKHKPQCGGNKP